MAKEICNENVNHLEFRSRNSVQFDAFISYAYEDRRNIIPVLRSLEEDDDLRLFLHERDYMPGVTTDKNIYDAINLSKRTVCCLTKHFLDSDWCMFELYFARMEAIYSHKGQTALLLIALEKDITKYLPLGIMDLVNSNSYMDAYTDKGDEEALYAFRAKLRETLKS